MNMKTAVHDSVSLLLFIVSVSSGISVSTVTQDVVSDPQNKC